MGPWASFQAWRAKRRALAEFRRVKDAWERSVLAGATHHRLSDPIGGATLIALHDVPPEHIEPLEAVGFRLLHEETDVMLYQGPRRASSPTPAASLPPMRRAAR
jgi:hypothetical protein